jgi:hypothetical protein
MELADVTDGLGQGQGFSRLCHAIEGSLGGEKDDGRWAKAKGRSQTGSSFFNLRPSAIADQPLAPSHCSTIAPWHPGTSPPFPLILTFSHFHILAFRAGANG